MKNHILKVSRPGCRLRSRSEKNSKTMTGNTWRLGILSLVVLNLLLGVSLAASKEPTFTTIDPPGSMFSWAVEINPAGEIVGANFSDTFHGYLLSKGEFTTIDFPGAFRDLCFRDQSSR